MIEDRSQHLQTIQDVGIATSTIDIAGTALALAAMDLPEVDPAPYMAHLDEISQAVADAAIGQDDLDQRPRALAQGLFGVLEYQGDSDTYDDMQNANLMRVIDRRRGLPVTLGILCLHAARAQGWPMVGINFPSHFLLKLEDPSGGLIVDPFNGAQAMDAPQLRALLKRFGGPKAELAPEHTRPVADREVLMRLQNNIKLRAIGAKDYDRAADILETMTLLIPEESRLAMERALVLNELGRLSEAAAVLSAYIDSQGGRPELFPDAAALLNDIRRRLN